MGIPSIGDSGHQGTESPLHEILVGIPSSGDSVQWGFRPVGIPGTYHIIEKKSLHFYRTFSAHFANIRRTRSTLFPKFAVHLALPHIKQFKEVRHYLRNFAALNLCLCFILRTHFSSTWELILLQPDGVSPFNLRTYSSST